MGSIVCLLVGTILSIFGIHAVMTRRVMFGDDGDALQLFIFGWRAVAIGFAALVLAATIAAYPWMNRQNPPVVLTYCVKYEGPHPPLTCVQTKKLNVPAAFGTKKVGNDWYELELVYPSMEPWTSLPWLERSNKEKLTIALRGVTTQTVQDIFAGYFLGTPKPVHLTPVYGLDQYLWQGWGKRQVLLPVESAPRFVMECAYGDDLDGENPFACQSTSYTDGGLKLVYSHRRALIPDSLTVHSKVHARIESLVIVP